MVLLSCGTTTEFKDAKSGLDYIEALRILINDSRKFLECFPARTTMVLIVQGSTCPNSLTQEVLEPSIAIKRRYLCITTKKWLYTTASQVLGPSCKAIMIVLWLFAFVVNITDQTITEFHASPTCIPSNPPPFGSELDFQEIVPQSLNEYTAKVLYKNPNNHPIVRLQYSHPGRCPT